MTSYKFTVSAVTGGIITQVKSSSTFDLLVKHPCLDANFTPNNLSVSPNQRNPDPYFYTDQGAFIQIESFIADPALCPVQYECIDVSGPSIALTCDSFSFASS